MLAGLYQNSKDKGELENKFVRMVFRTVVVLSPAVLIGLRGLNVGYDTEAMTYLLFSGPFSLDYLLENQHDPLSILFAHVANSVFVGNESAYLFSVSFITLFIMFAAIEKWSDLISIPFALMVYYLYFALIGMDQFKQVFSMLSDMLFIFSGLRAKRNPFLKRSCSSAFWLPHSTQMLFSRNSPNCSEREHTRCIFRVGSMTGRKERKTPV